MGRDRLRQTSYQYSILSQERVMEMGHGYELTVYDDERVQMHLRVWVLVKGYRCGNNGGGCELIYTTERYLLVL